MIDGTATSGDFILPHILFASLVMLRLAFSRLCFPRYHSRFNPSPSLRPSFSTGRPAQNSLQQHGRCPKCSIILPTALPACPNCHYISQLDNTPSYHNLFQLPFEPNPFVVDTSKLKRRYLEAQKICHPDTWATHGTVCSHFLIHLPCCI
jgi:molecular chaperone HscB